MAGVALNHTGIVGVVIAVIIMVFWYYFESKERLHFDRTLASLHTITDSIREKLRSLDIESPLPAKLGKQLSFKYEDRHLLSYAGWCCLCGDDADKVFGPRASHYLPQADIPPSTFHAEGDYLVRSQTESIVSVKDLESHLDYCKYVSDDESQLVCYSRLGFSPEAEEFAAANHIELVDLRQVIKAYQTSLVASFILKSDDSKER